METLEACNAAVLGINPGTLDDHQRSQAQLGLTFPLLHDPGAQVAALYARVRKTGRSAGRSSSSTPRALFAMAALECIGTKRF